jgi:hypothetical protein
MKLETILHGSVKRELAHLVVLYTVKIRMIFPIIYDISKQKKRLPKKISRRGMMS